MAVLLLDCDTGVDDAFALLAAALDPSTALVGVGCVWGNIDVQQAARNSHYVLKLIGATRVPVAVGEAGPLNGSVPTFSAHVHGTDGQGGAAVVEHQPELSDESAVEQLLRLSHSFPGELQIVAIGPLTNLARALQLDPTVADRVRRVTIMGGAALSPGNLTPSAEANIFHDPEAAALVFEAAWPVTMVGLDATMRTQITEQHRKQLLAGGPAGQYCAAILEHYLDFYTEIRGRRAAANHDALAVAVATGQVEVTRSAQVPVVIDTTDGPCRGRTVADLRGMWAGQLNLDGARHRVVLETAPGYEDRLIDQIASLR